MDIYEKLMLLLNTVHCLFFYGKENLLNEMGSIRLLPGLAFLKAQPSFYRAQQPCRFWESQKKNDDISKIKHAIHI